MASSATASALSVRRLLQEQQELHRNPIPGVAVKVDESDVRKIFVNMAPFEGPYAGTIVHMHLVFEAYPDKPPAVQLKTRLEGHPNVFNWYGDDHPYICLDMLKEHATGPYKGWSVAYTLPNVLRQLYGFLLVDDKIEQEYGGSVARSSSRSRSRGTTATSSPPNLTAPCACGFTHRPVAPPPPPSQQQEQQQRAADDVPHLPADVLGIVMAHADATTVAVCSQIQGELGQRAQEELRREEERCFYTHEPLGGGGFSSTVVLGYGISVAKHRDGEVKALSMRMDLLSYAAYRQHGVRRSAWNEPFDTFLPLALNAEHSARALRVFEAMLPELRGHRPSQGLPGDILSAMAKLMNSLVVEVCSTHQQQQQAELSRHMSDAALQGFCHLHHLLLALAERTPALLDAARRDVAAFMASPEARHKRQCPDLGMLLIKLMLVPSEEAPWEAFGPAFLRELLARQVRFVQQKPECGAAFAFPQPDDDDCNRCKKQFESSFTSLTLVCIEVWFANALARPKARGSARQELAAIRAAYDAANGRPPERVFVRFNEHARGVRRIGSWGAVLGHMHMSVRGEPATPEGARRTFANVLRQAALDSNRAGYSMECGYSARKASRELCFEAWAPGAMPVCVVPLPW